MRRSAFETWPALAKFLETVIHGDDSRVVQDDVQEQIGALPLSERENLAREWWNWNATAGAIDDIRFAIEAFDSGFAFDTADHARAFMNDVYDRLIVSVRSEAGKGWRP